MVQESVFGNIPKKAKQWQVKILFIFMKVIIIAYNLILCAYLLPKLWYAEASILRHCFSSFEFSFRKSKYWVWRNIPVAATATFNKLFTVKINLKKEVSKVCFKQVSPFHSGHAGLVPCIPSLWVQWSFAENWKFKRNYGK